MLDLVAHNLAPIMFITVMAMLLIGYPVAFTLAAGGMYFFVAGVELSEYSPEIRLSWPLAQANMNRVFDIMRNDTLLAIPFFTFMGLILERSRMAEDLLDTVGQLFGTLRGGLAFAVIIVGALLAATTGVVAASVIAMGLISLPIMMRYNYNPGLAAGTIAASGTLAQIIPPSLVLIVMADQLGRSVGDMYVGAFFPAMIVVGMYCAYIFAIALIKPHWVPALPPEARPLGNGGPSLILILLSAVALFVLGYIYVFQELRYETRVVWSALAATIIPYAFAMLNRTLKLGFLSRMAEQVVIVLIPPLALIFLVLGTIFLGIATPTEGGAMGASGALVMASMKRRLDMKTLVQALDSTAKLATFVMFILIGARVFSLTFYGIAGDRWVEELMLALPGGENGFLVTISIIVFILGCFLDFFEIAFILVPLLAPVAEKLGIDLIWFGVLLGFNLQASFLTPPFGFALFYLRSVAPIKAWHDKTTDRMIDPITTKAIYTGTLPFIIIQIVMLGILIAFPGLVTHYKTDPIMMDQNDIDDAINNIGSGGFGLPGSGLSLDGGFGLPGTPGSGDSGDVGMPAMPNFGGPSQPADSEDLPAPEGLPAPGGATGLPNFN
ncbi:TRAP transporter large permease subunit [Hoeflea sp. YIM 152468]|uniref:TRAP transporter large permease n=1 Tax=Hoeflea sp. YIM 152468 TaxID=3031759 RepID=UPI0023DB1019|nr:TRAP transporter large permease subunit [Hoeflea sp. YIM 152468]MDF1609190.1 TRAP transporter large permease subunit [Hoeflea sp. YIM 152468]